MQNPTRKSLLVANTLKEGYANLTLSFREFHGSGDKTFCPRKNTKECQEINSKFQ